MTALFDTDNIFYLPPGLPLTIYDLLYSRRIRIHLQSLRIYLDARRKDAVAAHAARVLDFAEALDDELDTAAERRRMNAFLDEFHIISNPAPTKSLISSALDPLPSSIWMRISQAPMESFFPEDYLETAHDLDGAAIVHSNFGAVVFNALGEDECDLPETDTPAFHLAGAAGCPIVESEPLDPLAPLPLLREYCGLSGSSNQGELVTIDLNGGIPQASLAAAPIRRSKENWYETIYMHLDLTTETPPARPIPPQGAAILAGNLRRMGFEAQKIVKRFSVWTRKGGDVIQLYRGLPGKEAENRPVLPPFAFCPLAGGGTDAGGRFGLLNEALSLK